MARVQEYLPEGQAQGPVGQTSPMLEQVQMFGKGIETAGRDINDAMTALNQRRTMAETSDAYASTSDMRAQYMERIQQATNDGSINDEDGPNSIDKIKSDYQDWVSKQADTYSMPGAKDAFNRASARAGGMILQHATSASVVVAGQKATADLTTINNNDSAAVLADPTQFETLREGERDYIQTHVEQGVWTPQQAAQVQKGMDIELSKATVRGAMQSLDYGAIKAAVMANGGDKVDFNAPEFNKATAALNSGAFDDILNTDHKKSLQEEILHNQQAAYTAGKLALTQKQDAINAQGEAFKGQAYEDIRLGKYDPSQTFKAFQEGKITAAEQLQLNHLSMEQGKDQQATDPRVFNSIRNRILSPDNSPGHISDPLSQIGPYVGKGLSYSNFHELAEMANMTGGNIANKFSEAHLIKQAEDQIGLKGDMADPNGEYKSMLYQRDLQNAKENALKAGQPVSSVFDPKSPNFMGGAAIQKYVATPAERMSAIAGKYSGQAPAPMPIQARPGVTLTPTAPSGNPAPGQIPTPSAPAPSGPWDKFKSDLSQARDQTGLTPEPEARRGWSPQDDFRGNTASSVPEIGKMSRADIQKNVGKMTPAQAQAALARLKQLKAGGQ